MPSNTRRLRKMIDELKSRGVGLDEIARRTGIPRGNIFKFSQGDHRQLPTATARSKPSTRRSSATRRPDSDDPQCPREPVPRHRLDLTFSRPTACRLRRFHAYVLSGQGDFR